MNITVNSQLLATELRLLNRIITTRPTLPILGHILFRAEPMSDQLQMRATDLEVQLSTQCKAVVNEPGTVALPAKTLLAIVEQLRDGGVKIQQDKQQVRIEADAFKSRLQTLPADDFPTLPSPNGTQSVLQAAGVQSLIAKTRYAISDKPGKYILDGALLAFRPEDEAVAMVATDTKRLAIATMPYTGPAGQAIVPSKTMDILTSLAGAPEIEFSQSENHLFFVYGEQILTSRVLDGKFPNYTRIIPRDNDKHAKFGRLALTSALRRVLSVSGEDQIVYLEFEDGQLTVTSRSADIGDADERIAIVYEGSPLKICINGKYVLDFLEASLESEVGLALKNEETPLLLTSGNSFINVVMLMRP